MGEAGGRGVGEAVGRDLDVEEMSLILLRMLYSKCEFLLHKCWSRTKIDSSNNSLLEWVSLSSE